MKQYVRLSFIGLDPDEITRRLGIKPTLTRRAAQERAADEVWRHDFWELTSEVGENEIVADAHFRALLKRLAPHFDAIRQLDSEPTISWVIHVGPDEATPDSLISAYTLAKIAELGACLDVDMYFDAQGSSASRGSTA
jgi:Domain of unknown function (DUF4279)